MAQLSDKDAPALPWLAQPDQTFPIAAFLLPSIPLGLPFPTLHPLTHKQSQLVPGMSRQEVLISQLAHPGGKAFGKILVLSGGPSPMGVLVLVSVPVPSRLGWLTCGSGTGPGREQDMWGTGTRGLSGSTVHSREKGILALSPGSTKLLQQC